jgi:hypothetical protein
MDEIKIKGFKDYTVTSNGKVFKRGKEIKAYLNRGGGYKQVKLWKNGHRVTKQVSRLVAGEPIGKDVDHKDFNKLNNNKSNLQVLTHRQNVLRNFE